MAFSHVNSHRDPLPIGVSLPKIPNPNMTNIVNPYQDPITDQGDHQNQQEQEEIEGNRGNPPPSVQPQPHKNLSLEIPDPPDDSNKDDPEDLTLFSPTLSDTQMSSRLGGGPKRRKPGKKRHAAQEKRILLKLETLSKTLKPVPFAPDKGLDFASHETLLKQLGLWDFVHLDFDFPVRADLIAQLIASYNPSARASYVNGARILVNRTDLARALKLPLKKEKSSVGENAVEVKESAEFAGFVEELVSKWVLLHDDTWMMPVEVFNWMEVVKEGNFERVDWASLVWFMVDKELTAAPSLGSCYYASHLQILIKSQKEELLVMEEEEPERMEVDVKDDTETVVEDERMTEECNVVSRLEEHNIELSLGGMDNDNNVVKDDDDGGDKEGKENVSDGIMMDFEDSRDGGEQEQWVNSGVNGGFLRPCSHGEVKDVDCNAGDDKSVECSLGDVKGVECSLADVKSVECQEEKEEELVDEEEEEEEGGKEEEGEEDEGEDVDFNISPKGDTLDTVGNENLLTALGAAQVPFSSGLQIHDDVSSGDFLASRGDQLTIPGSSSLFGNAVNKREIDHIENDLPHHMINGGNKRMRGDDSWDTKSSPDLDVCLDHLEHWARKARMAQAAKEQEHQQLSMSQQQVWINEVQQRDSMIQHLHKAKLEEQQKRQVQVYRLEHELYMMGNLLEGYRKALKETHRAFAEYRAKYQLPERPIYQDAGSGGLVLSTTELEKLRLKQEEERRLNRIIIEKKVKEFEAGWAVKFEAFNEGVDLLNDKVQALEKEVNILKISVKSKASEMAECAPVEN